MSARVTRQSKRIAYLSATATPLSTVSPIFSSGRQSIATETPITSEGSEDEAVLDDPAKPTQTKRVTRSVSVRGVKKLGIGKRPAASDDDADATESLRAQKRRAISTQVYVSIPVKSKDGKAKVCGHFRVLNVETLNLLMCLIAECTICWFKGKRQAEGCCLRGRIRGKRHNGDR